MLSSLVEAINCIILTHFYFNIMLKSEIPGEKLAARALTSTRRSAHITHLLYDLH